jgi:hypothetical protein
LAEEFSAILLPKLSDFPATIIVYASQFSGGDKPHPYLSGETSFVVAGFIPACKGRKCRKNCSITVLTNDDYFLGALNLQS